MDRSNLSLFGILLIKLLALATKLNAMPTDEVVIQQKVYLMKNLVEQLHKIHHFQNIVLYRNSKNFYTMPLTNFVTLRNRDQGRYLHEEIMGKSISNIFAEYIWSSELHLPLVSFIISPWEYINNTNAIPNLGNILKNRNLAIVITNDIFSMDLREFVAASLGACPGTKIVFLLIGHELTNVLTFVRFDKLKQFFRWCWSKNILNVILIFQKKHIEQSLDELELEVFTYTPFPRPIKIIQLTKEQPKDYFPLRTNNLMGYKFKAPIIADKPLVFKTQDSLTGHEAVTGISGKTFMEYVKNVNGAFEELRTENISSSMAATINYIHNLLKSRSIDISVHPVTALVPNKFSTSYPISNTNTCVVAPIKQDIHPSLYISQCLSLELWILLLALFVTFQLTYMFINYGSYGRLRPWLAFSTTLLGMLYMPVGNMGDSKTITKNSAAGRRKICLHMFLLLTGMVFSLTLIASMTSFLTNTLYPQQIESLEDLVKANLSIMMVDYIYDTYKYLDLIPENFTQNLIITDAETVSYHLNQLDTRYAYTVYNEQWKVMQRLQKPLWKPRFKIVSKLCIPNVYLILPTQFNSPFHSSLKKFFLHSQLSGLDIKWSNMIHWQIYQNNSSHATIRNNTERDVTFGLQHLTYILYIYAGGMTAATLIFLIELNWAFLCKKFYRNKIKRHF